MLEFNKRGFLIPDRNINTTIEEFEETFAPGDYFYWKDKFAKTKRNRAGNRMPLLSVN